jgi:hypothetical protein
MSKILWDLILVAYALGFAVYVAITLGYLALFRLGFSSELVRGFAMITAMLMAAFVAIEFFGKKLRKAK